MFSWTYMLIIYCCYGNSTQLKKDIVWVKNKWNVHPLKPSWRGPFVIILSTTPTAVKVAEIAPWIHHNWVKPASLEWQCISDLASQCKITLWNLSALPWQNSASQEATGAQEQWDDCPALVTPEADWSTHGRSLRSQLSNGTNELFSTPVISL
jgi:hypothetical protein